MLRTLAVLILSALLLEAAQPALAQKTGPNGGLLAGKDGHQTELVVSPTELTVYILDRRLRADAVRVSVFRQVRGANGWADAQTNPDTGIRLENAILSRARELRLASIAQ